MFFCISSTRNVSHLITAWPWKPVWRTGSGLSTEGRVSVNETAAMISFEPDLLKDTTHLFESEQTLAKVLPNVQCPSTNVGVPFRSDIFQIPFHQLWIAALSRMRVSIFVRALGHLSPIVSGEIQSVLRDKHSIGRVANDLLCQFQGSTLCRRLALFQRRGFRQFDDAVEQVVLFVELWRLHDRSAQQQLRSTVLSRLKSSEKRQIVKRKDTIAAVLT